MLKYMEENIMQQGKFSTKKLNFWTDLIFPQAERFFVLLRF